MRVMPFIQVLLLATMLVYLLLVGLENPSLVRLPLPFGGGEELVSLGTVLTGFSLAGALLSALLFLPSLLHKHAQYLYEKREKRAAEKRLSASLQARLGAVPKMVTVVAAPEPQELSEQDIEKARAKVDLRKKVSLHRPALSRPPLDTTSSQHQDHSAGQDFILDEEHDPEDALNPG